MTGYSPFTEDISSILKSVKEKTPLIHCITNPISINDCANTILALGARPIMAEHPGEVADITKSASSLCLNIGNITDARMESIRLSAKTAMENGIPFVLDVVGITCSELRYAYIAELLSEVTPSVIKGNLSEIKRLAGVQASFVGVDSTENLNNGQELTETALLVKKLAIKTGCVIAASGRTDILSDGNSSLCIDNGSKMLARLTGTGCMLNVTIGTLLASAGFSVLTKAALGTAILGICGELAEERHKSLPPELWGNGTYHISLINALSCYTIEDIQARLKIRVF